MTFPIRCDNKECGCNKPRSYWLEIDPQTGNPKGSVCWAYYGINDKPIVGNWILVREVEKE